MKCNWNTGSELEKNLRKIAITELCIDLILLKRDYYIKMIRILQGIKIICNNQIFTITGSDCISFTSPCVKFVTLLMSTRWYELSINVAIYMNHRSIYLSSLLKAEQMETWVSIWLNQVSLIYVLVNRGVFETLLTY